MTAADFKAARLALGVTQQEFADLLGIATNKHISDMERGVRNVSATVALLVGLRLRDAASAKKTECHLSDVQILRALDAVAAKTGWISADLLIDMVAESEGVDRELVAAIHAAGCHPRRANSRTIGEKAMTTIDTSSEAVDRLIKSLEIPMQPGSDETHITVWCVELTAEAAQTLRALSAERDGLLRAAPAEAEPHFVALQDQYWLLMLAPLKETKL